MNTNSFSAINLFKELITCDNNIYYWKYNANQELITTNCPNLLLHKIFKESNTFSAVLNHPGHTNHPAVLSGEYGIQWCAAVEIDEKNDKYIHVAGPTFATEFSSADLEEMIKNANIPLSARTILAEAIKSIPVIGTSLLYQLSLMLYYCVTGEKCQRSQILSIAALPLDSEYYRELKRHIKDVSLSNTSQTITHRRKTYEFERRLLNNVRNGNLDFQKDLNMALTISDSVNLSSGAPIHSLQNSGLVFITLCTRAAIEGGLAPDISYSLGDGFIDKVNHARSAAEIKTILDEMYKAFIVEVNFLKTKEGISHQILDIMNYIENYPGEDLSLDALSSRIGYVNEHLSRKFKAETGQTISSYIRNARIEKSKEYLISTQMKISEIASSLGFASSSLFASYFCEIVGMSPSEYREQNYLL